MQSALLFYFCWKSVFVEAFKLAAAVASSSFLSRSYGAVYSVPASLAGGAGQPAGRGTHTFGNARQTEERKGKRRKKNRWIEIGERKGGSNSFSLKMFFLLLLLP